ncbi:MAG: hypothetical protein JO175_00125, partial [Candidatus Eremiobacteraeota bacterium]|nr:hypothetical protein [Candidatus Eremiobacteraeota bacterium]
RFFQVSASGGTSAAAPEMSAMWTLVLQACKQTPSCATAAGPKPYRLGNAAPLLYAIFQGKKIPGAPKIVPANRVFFDVVQGNTDAYPPNQSSGPLLKGNNAGPGYDLVTGIGAPFAGHLIQAITGQSVP